jgi:hypothetical protein
MRGLAEGSTYALVERWPETNRSQMMCMREPAPLARPLTPTPGTPNPSPARGRGERPDANGRSHA